MENFLEMCVLLPGDIRAAGALRAAARFNEQRSSAGSPSQAAVNWDAAGTGTGDGGGRGRQGSVTARIPSEDAPAGLFGVLSSSAVQPRGTQGLAVEQSIS